MLTGILSNWKTSSAGLLTAVGLIVDGFHTHDWLKIVAGVGALLTGLAASDAGPAQQ